VIYSRIVGTGSYLPERVLTNVELEKTVDTTDEWIRERTGIVKRHIAAPDQTCSELAEYAARRALDAAHVGVSDVDLIIVATTTPDQIFPSTACLLQRRLGIHGCPAFDVQAVCAGFIYALAIADKFIHTGAARCALVVGSEVLSRILDWNDRNTCVLFGDGAGAVVLQAATAPGIILSKLHADGDYKELLEGSAGIGVGYDDRPGRRPCITMQGNEVFKFAVRTLGRIADETLASAGLGRADVDWLIPHQANIRIIQATARKLNLPMERVIVTVGEHGNTSAASIPLALDVAVRDGRIRHGENVLMEAFGGGFTWGAILATF
jgi:3-oxoacyl-[acyl-carrier-protein] synthase III